MEETISQERYKHYKSYKNLFYILCNFSTVTCSSQITQKTLKKTPGTKHVLQNVINLVSLLIFDQKTVTGNRGARFYFAQVWKLL